MFSYISSIFNNFFNNNSESNDDDDIETFLADQLINLELCNENTDNDINKTAQPEIAKNIVCFERTGLITYISDNDYVLIDGMLYYDLSACSLSLNVNDKVVYLAYKDDNDSITVVRILENQGLFWGDEENAQESSFKVIEHIILGEVDHRENRLVYLKESDLKFDLDNVEATFVPIKGDWLQMKCKLQWDEDKPSDISSAQVLQVISIKPLRSKIKTAVVTDWSGECGVCDRQIYLDKQCLQNGIKPQVGSKVMVEIIESSQGTCTWRVLKLISCENSDENNKSSTVEEISFALERNNNVDITFPLKFDKVVYNDKPQITLNITNNSDQIHIINKWIILSKKRDSQLDIKPFLHQPRRLHPKQIFSMTITCHPKFLGNAKESLIIMFKGFQVKRFIEISVVDENHDMNCNKNEKRSSYKTEHDRIECMKKIRNNNDRTFIPGIRPLKPPAFIPVKLGVFPIPDKIWNAVLGDSEQTVYSSEYYKILDRIETHLPCLSQDLNIRNYIDKWHTLLYMEEIQANINMRSYDMPKAFLMQCQEYFSIEINGLSERRPSLIKGDRVIVKDIWNTNIPQYEGYIHAIKGDLVLLKFNPNFHETYTGGDVSIEFHFNRSLYRRCHQAINLAISNLGPDILFPTRIPINTPQMSTEEVNNMKWYNTELNDGQKSAVSTILLGECRPLPYCIFGPPGTGKTVTVIETILQILTLLPHSRILVATPSNSAANLIMERLLKYSSIFSDSIVRLIANYLVDSDSIPDIIKPYCATLDIAKENTAKSKHEISKDGIYLNCRTTFVGRQRVTIGTCFCIGTLALMGLPRGHFTHIIIDEAGQATEPEIMIPMTFTDKENGRIVLAGDPMQLGPVIMSKYCKEFGMDESLMSRLLETFPYQKDLGAFTDGFDKRLITKLNDNYRSLEEVLKLPSEMFYNASLVAKIDRNEPWISRILKVNSDIFDSVDSNTGGIFVYGIRGCNTRAEDSPSWYNPQEASMVALTICKLYKKNVTVDEIGIITPYIAQIKYLRVLFEAMGLPQPKIGTVEDFQGQERPLILISTVRSSESYLEEDQKHTLGFIRNPKRINVALTRAQVVVQLFCDPHLLCKDTLWHNVLQHAIKEDKYMGCDLPVSLQK